MKSAGDGYYYIVSKLSGGTNCYLTVAEGADKNGANVEISTFTGDDSQKFRLRHVSGSSYLITTKCSGDAKCVEVAEYSTSAGANVQQWEITETPSQLWTFETV